MSTDAKMKRRLKARIAVVACSIAMALAVAGVLIWVFAGYLPDKHRKEDNMTALQNYYDAKVQQFQAENEALGEKQVEIVFLGDSLTDGYDLAAFLPQYYALNRGIGGDTTVGLAKRMDISLYQVRPKVTVMLIGANNMHTMLSNYEQLVMDMHTHLPDTKIVLLSLTSMAGDWAHNNQLAAYNNAFIKRYAEKYGCAYIDLYTPLFDTDTGEMDLKYTTDGGHFTQMGYKVITSAIEPILQQLLGH